MSKCHCCGFIVLAILRFLDFDYYFCCARVLAITKFITYVIVKAKYNYVQLRVDDSVYKGLKSCLIGFKVTVSARDCRICS